MCICVCVCVCLCVWDTGRETEWRKTLKLSLIFYLSYMVFDFSILWYHKSRFNNWTKTSSWRQYRLFSRINFFFLDDLTSIVIKTYLTFVHAGVLPQWSCSICFPPLSLLHSGCECLRRITRNTFFFPEIIASSLKLTASLISKKQHQKYVSCHEGQHADENLFPYNY